MRGEPQENHSGDEDSGTDGVHKKSRLPEISDQWAKSRGAVWATGGYPSSDREGVKEVSSFFPQLEDTAMMIASFSSKSDLLAVFSCQP